MQHKLQVKEQATILLINPCADKLFIRDYFCSHLSKGTYYWPPLDLLVLSGWLKENFEVKVIDAQIKKQSLSDLMQQIKTISPDYIISVTGASSWSSDINILAKINQEVKTKFIISGDFARAEPGQILTQYEFIEAIILDFTDSDIIKMLRGEKSSALKNIFTRGDKEVIFTSTSKEFSYPVPQHELFPLKKYHLPHLKYHPFTTIMTDFSCPYVCTFCPFEKIPYKKRSTSNIELELKHIHNLKIKEIWLRDQSFGVDKQQAAEVCKIFKNFNPQFSWSAEMRVDSVEKDLLLQMKHCGCHTIMLGVESASQEVLDAHQKKISLRQIEETFSLAKKVGLKTLAHFILGLKGENKISQTKLIDFSLSLDPDYVSFNIAAPLWNTTFRETLTKNKNLNLETIEVDSSASYPVWESNLLSREDVWDFRKEALRKFYLRPSYLLKSLKNLKSFYQARQLIGEGVHLLKELFFKKN